MVLLSAIQSPGKQLAYFRLFLQFTIHNKVHIDGDSRISTVKATCICYAQTMDVDNPWIVLLKAWIRACTDNLCIACSIRRSCEMKGTEHGFGQSSDTDMPFGRLFERAGVAGMKLSNYLSLQNQAALSQIGKLGKYIAWKMEAHSNWCRLSLYHDQKFEYSIILLSLQRWLPQSKYKI